MAPQIAFLGMGLMGKVRWSSKRDQLHKNSYGDHEQAMTKNLVLYGKLDKPLKIYNRTKSHAEKHSAIIGHSRVTDTIKEAILGSSIIWSCLQDQEAVEATFGDILGSDIKGKLFIESSSITPKMTNSIAKQVVSAGGEFVALPGMCHNLYSACLQGRKHVDSEQSE